MQEVILKLGGEGETLSLIGTRGTDGLRKYHIQTSSEALSELLSESDSLPSSKQQLQIKVSSWKKACDLLEQYPSWYKLHQIDIHPDFASKIHKLFSTKNDSSIHHNKIKDISRPDNTSNTDTKLHVNTQLNSISIDKIKELYEQYYALIKLEIEEFGVKATEVRHLIGRIGEFYCALKVGGALASRANQHGFDVISKHGKTISVKATAQVNGFVAISASTANLADELMLIQYTAGKLNIVYYGPMEPALDSARHYPEKMKFELDIGSARKLESYKSKVSDI
jgi:hypothetical protein